ncbi:Efflux pump mlcE [Lasiodiplodia theobromae]|uniref:Efflux pump mlcE n=1 Tax=Lasiodiplodia theobromae TaxID=45133 RepID=A0A5N5D670_9PEZI|nr:Efflux pump mlcE [Lasiodiplodia theobromae]
MATDTTSTTEMDKSTPTSELDGTAEKLSMANSSESDDRDYITGPKLFLVLGSLTLVVFLILLDITILGTAIPEITTEFNALADAGWYIGAYQLASASLQLMSGKLYTYFNNKYTFLVYFAFFELGSLICAVANSSSLFIGGRAIAGLGSAGIINGGMTIISGAVPLIKRPLYTGILLGTAQMGIVAAPIIGGTLTQHVTWRWCFYLNLPAGGAAAILLFFVQIPELTKKERLSRALVRRIIPELDLIGSVLFVPSSLMFLLALQFGSAGTYAWSSSQIIGLFVGAGVLALVFFAWEYHQGDKAMLPGNLLRQRTVWASCAFGTCLVCCVSVATNWLPTYFQAVKGEGPTMSGVDLLPSIISQLIFVIISGAGTARLGYYLPFALFSGVTTTVGNGLVSTFNASTSSAQWIGYQVLMGIGRGAGMQMSLVAIQNAIPTSKIPIGMACVIFFQTFGTSVAVVISNTIFTQTLTSTIPRYAPSVPPHAALSAGSSAEAVRMLIPAGRPDELNGILRAYSESLRNVFYFLVGLAACATVFSLGMGWKNVGKKKKQEEEKAAEPGKAEAT